MQVGRLLLEHQIEESINLGHNFPVVCAAYKLNPNQHYKQLKGIVETIAREIYQQGSLSFARFMELALYCPDCGYYEKEEDKIGRRGDFFTSVSVGSLFGELLAFQFAEWLDELKTRNPKPETRNQIVEAGAHNGQLAKDILHWLRAHRPTIFDAIEYVIVEPSAHRQRWQMETLAEFGNRVQWVSDLKTLADGVRGIIFSNELLDAMPVHRLGWDAKEKKWFEWGVTIDANTFVWQRMEKSRSGFPSSILQLPFSLLNVLPDGFTTEISPTAENWWLAAAQTLRQGKLLAIDYGLLTEEFFTPERSEGTLRSYFRHHLTSDLLANPGEQDLTAQVNFTAIQKVGETVGLKTEMFVTQSKFLTQIVEQIARKPTGFEWNPERARRFQTLTHPEHLGRSFRVMIQSRD
jgi:SAM-dependent MidA family methyltransferase